MWYSYAGGTETTGAMVEQTVIDSYDALGRPLFQRQRFKTANTWKSYQIERTYDRAGQVKWQKYPSGNSVTYNYDEAGRLADKDAQNPAFKGTLGDGAPRTYSRGITYSSFGSITQEQFGTDVSLYHKLSYNALGQLAEIRLSTLPDNDNWNRGKIINDYSEQCSGAACNAADNNGNLRKQHVFIPNNEQNTSSTSWYQQYTYDHLNRLQETREHASDNSLLWHQTYTYDRHGNRTIDANATTDGINERAFEIETTTNRLLAPGDSALTGPSLPQRKMRYDAAGNLTNDLWSSSGSSTPGATTMTYDAENKMTSALNSSGGVSYYTYNADGQRVRRKIGGVETLQVYGFDGELLAEYAAESPHTNPQKEYGYRGGQLLITAEPASATNSSGYNGTTADIPGTVQMENFDDGAEGSAYHDTTAGSHGQDYDQSPANPTPSFRQPTDVDIYKWSGYSNGYLVLGQAGEWLNYTVSVASTGVYTMDARVAWGAAAGSFGTFHVEVDGVDKTGPIQIPDTNWNLATITKSGVQLTAGQHVLRVVWDINAGNGYVGDIDYLSFQAANGQSPYTGTALPIPGTVETEYFDNGGEGVAYHDTTAGTHGQDYNNPPNFPPPNFRTTSERRHLRAWRLQQWLFDRDAVERLDEVHGQRHAVGHLHHDGASSLGRSYRRYVPCGS